VTKAKRKPSLADWARKANAVTPSQLLPLLKRTQLSLDEIGAKLNVSRGVALDLVDALRSEGYSVQKFGERFTVTRDPGPVEDDRDLFHLRSDAGGRYRFGVISDTHYGSKYAREDVCEDLYDWFAAEGIDLVLHGGNWIDGEARFNRFDLIERAHGMQAQLDYFVERYPHRRGIRTHYVTGDDHEGWYAQREGVDIGRMLEETARRAGRNDLRNLGYIEAFVTLEHRKSGETSKILLQHPGGGSAYAVSYAPQKIIEALQPGEKPGVAILGHLHKLEYLNLRGVHVIQAGCTKDVDTFARKKRLSYHIGGWIVELWQHPGGAIEGCRPWLKQYFDRDYYNGQWSLSGPLDKKRAPHGTSRKHPAKVSRRNAVQRRRAA
jgi:predicted phosphodiesterase/biotin operon repressor